MYPDVFIEFVYHQKEYGNVSVLPTHLFFYGLPLNEEITINIEEGKTLILKLLANGHPDPEGNSTVFFELNGQPREVIIPNQKIESSSKNRKQADLGNPKHIGSPMPGMIVQINFKAGEKVKKGDALITLEAMKMETTIYAEEDASIGKILIEKGDTVKTKDLLVIYE